MSLPKNNRLRAAAFYKKGIGCSPNVLKENPPPFSRVAAATPYRTIFQRTGA
jgi:hypothetical protein